ncbi:UDP-Glycosyltransferase/glycogen phosphorylase [Serendipita vermifera]|nr:UDP-Glycosyltransferase/glycogen phosphorylase [Serendipita vermifera]
MSTSPNGNGEHGPIPPKKRKLQLKPKGTRRPGASLSPIFIGLALRIQEDQTEYAVVVHDGMGVVGSEHDVHHRSGQVSSQDITNVLLERAKEYCRARGHTISLFALAGPLDPPLDITPPTLDVDRENFNTFASRLWLELDAIPIFVPCRETQFSLEGEATHAVEEALKWLHPTTTRIIEATTSTLHKEVQVDADGLVRLYDLSQQAALTSSDLWDAFTRLGQKIRNNKVRVSFFSATPRGGGVALMRHALIRLWRLSGLNVRWYVPQGDSAVFDITKRKFHNVLQGVAPPNVELTSEDKSLYERWIRWNYEKFWEKKDKCPTKAEVVVIDDPQLIGLVPYIRRDSPSTKIIYRSHIEIRSDLIDSKKSPQAEVWEYLWGFISQADLFISHPIKEFVPRQVPETMPVVYMPPSTDPLDGLNKPIPEESMGVYRKMMQDVLSASTGQVINWNRGYIIQIARFDPSKGIPHLIEGYRIFREKYKDHQGGNGKNTSPQLILIGHTSVDDPDASWVLHKIQEMLTKPEFEEFRDDVYAARAPPEDRLLNTLLRGADVACQVSTREGFEIKVTEAIHKNRWIIGSKAGGIPLQIRDGIDGTIVPPGDPDAIADALFDYYTKRKAGESEGLKRANDVGTPLGGRWEKEGSGAREEFFTVGNATMWQFLWCTILGLVNVSEGDSEATSQDKATGRGGVSALHQQLVWKAMQKAQKGKHL